MLTTLPKLRCTDPELLVLKAPGPSSACCQQRCHSHHLNLERLLCLPPTHVHPIAAPKSPHWSCWSRPRLSSSLTPSCGPALNQHTPLTRCPEVNQLLLPMGPEGLYTSVSGLGGCLPSTWAVRSPQLGISCTHTRYFSELEVFENGDSIPPLKRESPQGLHCTIINPYSSI